MTGIFDSHAHYDDSVFDEDREALLMSLPARGIANVINCATDVATSCTCLSLAEKYDYIYAACGVHPHEASDCQEDWQDRITEFCSEPKCVAIGEIGLDYHYDFSPRDVQLDVFAVQLELAVKLNIPVIVHDREAHADTLELLKKYRPKGVVHCFSGSVEMAKEIISLGMYIGLGGAVTFKNARKPAEVAAFVPSDKLLIETDCPYMTPVPFRGTRNDSTYIPYSAEVIGQIRGVDAAEILNITACNARRLFRIV